MTHLFITISPSVFAALACSATLVILSISLYFSVLLSDLRPPQSVVLLELGFKSRVDFPAVLTEMRW